MTMRQSLISIEHPLRLSGAIETQVDARAWRVHIIAGQLDDWRDVAAKTAEIAWRDAARAIRAMTANVVGEDETIYAFARAGAEVLADLIPMWSVEDSWVSPPRPGIPENTPAHVVTALRSSPYPPPEFVPGDVYRRIPACAFPDEEWWPGPWSFSGTALSFPTSSDGEYRERLEDALQRGDYDLARKLVLFSPQGGENVDISTFEKNPEMLNSVTLYVAAGAPARCAVGVHFYSRRVSLTAFLTSAIDVLVSAGYECRRSEGVETFKQWVTAGRLPSDLMMLTRESLVHEEGSK